VSGDLTNKKRTLITAVISAGCIIIAALTSWLYMWYPTTPVYSLSQVSDAFREHDWNRFSRYVDLEKLSMGLAKEITFIAYQKMDEKGVPSHISKNLAVTYGASVKKSLPGDFEAWVKNGSPPAASVLGTVMKGSGSGKFGLKGILWNNGIARAKVSTGKTAVLEIELVSEQGIWRITRISNVIELYEKSKGKF
jgi:hypothetical protein